MNTTKAQPKAVSASRVMKYMREWMSLKAIKAVTSEDPTFNAFQAKDIYGTLHTYRAPKLSDATGYCNIDVKESDGWQSCDAIEIVEGLI